MEIKKKDGGSYEPAKPQSTIISKKPATIFKRQEFQIETFSRTENSLSPGKFFFLKKTAGFWRSERKSPSCCKRTIQGQRRFVVSHRWTRSWKLWSPPTHSLLALLFGFCARDESKKLKWGDIVLQQTTKRARNFWFGNQKEDPRPAAAIVIHEHLIQPRRQQTTNVVQFYITRNSPSRRNE